MPYELIKANAEAYRTDIQKQLDGKAQQLNLYNYVLKITKNFSAKNYIDVLIPVCGVDFPEFNEADPPEGKLKKYADHLCEMADAVEDQIHSLEHKLSQINRLLEIIPADQ